MNFLLHLLAFFADIKSEKKKKFCPMMNFLKWTDFPYLITRLTSFTACLISWNGWARLVHENMLFMEISLKRHRKGEKQEDGQEKEWKVRKKKHFNNNEKS